MFPPQLRCQRKDAETKARGRRRVTRPEAPPDSSKRGRPEKPGPTSPRYSPFRQQKSHRNVGSLDIRWFQCPYSPSMSPLPYRSVVDSCLILSEVAAWNLSLRRPGLTKIFLEWFPIVRVPPPFQVIEVPFRKAFVV